MSIRKKYEGLVEATTDLAVLIDIDGDEVWLPLSQCIFDDDEEPYEGVEITVTIPEWLAKEKGLAD